MEFKKICGKLVEGTIGLLENRRQHYRMVIKQFGPKLKDGRRADTKRTIKILSKKIRRINIAIAVLKYEHPIC